ncbi:MAG: LytTR family DNA-binding domain-containing protein [Defluviitaleaceae bacterium]|nr:LytTR family DNA-binding domain-containing protein [Defluviitaleaceae bacterium]
MVMIAICDDDTKISSELERFIADILGKLSVKHQIDVFTTGEELIKAAETGSHFDLIFLDIKFAEDGVNGIEVGRVIRDVHQNHLVSIVYISREKDYALELFDIGPLNFLVKPLKREKLEAVIGKYLRITGLWTKVFTYKIGHDTSKVQIKDIVYLESLGKKLVIYLADSRKVEFYGTLKAEYSEQLQKFDFLFIHNAYVVNYDYISALKVDQVVLVNSGLPLPVSRHRRNEVKESYYTIMKRRMGV